MMKQYKTREDLWKQGEQLDLDPLGIQVQYVDSKAIGQINDMLIEMLEIMRKEKKQ